MLKRSIAEKPFYFDLYIGVIWRVSIVNNSLGYAHTTAPIPLPNQGKRTHQAG